MKYLKVFLLTLVLFGFSISPNWAQSNNPILTIGCLSDLHCGEASGSSSSSGTLATSVTTTVQKIKQTENLDAIFVGGDIVSGNSISQDAWNTCRTNTVNALLSAFQKSTTSTALSGAKTATPLYIVTGNHEFQSCGNRGSYNSADYYNTISGNKYGMQYYTNELKSTTTSTVSANPNEAYYETLSGVTDSNGKNHVACYHYQLNGIDIIGINTSVETYNSASSTPWRYSEGQANWVARKLELLTQNDKYKRIFVVEHIPFSDNDNGSSEHGLPSSTATSTLKSAMAKCPNLIMFFGHDHSSSKAYIATNTSERVTHYDANGNKLTKANTTSHIGDSFSSVFMGSMNYRSYQSVYQALMIYVYSDRVVLSMKNYGATGTVGGGSSWYGGGGSTTFNDPINDYTIYMSNGQGSDTPSVDPEPQPATGDGLYLMNMGNSKYLQMVKKATDDANNNNNDGQLGFVSSIDGSTTGWAFTQYNSSLVKLADSSNSNFVYFGNKGDSGSTYAYKLTGMAKYNKSGNPEAAADNQSSAGAGTKYNCYLYKINNYSASGSSFTATLTTTAEAGGYYFIASANVQSSSSSSWYGQSSSSTGMMLMGNTLSSGSQITIDGTQISSTPGSSSITVNVSNIQNYVYQFVSNGSTPIVPPTPPTGGDDEFYISNGGNYVNMPSADKVQLSGSKQAWTITAGASANTFKMTASYNNRDYTFYYSYEAQGFSPISNITEYADEYTGFYFFDASTGKLATSLAAGNSYYIVVKSLSGNFYMYNNSVSDGYLQRQQLQNSTNNYYISAATSGDITTSTTVSVTSNAANYQFTLESTGTTPQPTDKTLYGTLSVSGSNGTVFASATQGAGSGSTSVSVNKGVAQSATSASQTIYLHATANANYTFQGWSETNGGSVIAGSNVAEYAYTFTFSGTSQSAATSKTLYAVFQQNGSSEQPTTGDGLYLMNMGNSKYLQMVKKATDTASSNNNDGQLGFVSSIDGSTTGWAFTQYNSSLVKLADSSNSNFVYFGNKGDSGSTYAYKLTGMAKYNKTGNPEAAADNQSSAGAGSKYNCYLYKISNYSASGSSFTATLTTTAEAGGYYFIASANVQSSSSSSWYGQSSSSTGMMLMGNTLSSGSQITIDGTQISSTPGSSSITVNVSNIQNYIYQFVSNGSTPQPTTKTLYGQLAVAATNGNAFISATAGATTGGNVMTVSEEVAADAEKGTKVLYLSAVPTQGYEFVGWSTDNAGSNIISTVSSNYAYTFEFGGTQTMPTGLTLYAIFKQQSQPDPTTKTLYGRVSVSAAHGTAFVTETSGATSGGNVLTVSCEVDKAASVATKTVYLHAKAANGYKFLGWATSSTATTPLANSAVSEFAYTFTFDGSAGSPTTRTLYAVFEQDGTPEPLPGDIEPSTDPSEFDYVMYLDDAEASTDTEVNLVLNMKNAVNDITGVEFNVCLPEGIEWTTTKNSRGETVLKMPTLNEERIQKEYHHVSVKEISEGVYKVIAYSDDNSNILLTDGALFCLPVTVSDDMEDGYYNIYIRDITMASQSVQQYRVEQTVSYIVVSSYTLGDVNNDGSINVTDIVATVSYLMGENPSPFVFKAADVNADNEINVTDIVGIIDIINGQSASRAIAANRMRSGSYQDSDYALGIVYDGQNVTLNMSNTDYITAFQCDVELSDGVEWISENGRYAMPEFNEEAGRTDGNYHNISVKRLEDGKLRVIVYSLNNDEFFGTEGAVLNLPLAFTKGASCSISNIVLAKKNADSEYLSGSTFSFDATNIDCIKNAQDANDVIFDINGVRSNKLMKGIYIINGAKVMVNE